MKEVIRALVEEFGSQRVGDEVDRQTAVAAMETAAFG